MAPANAATLLMIFLFFVEKRLYAAVDRRTFVWTSTVFGMGGLCLLLSLTRSCWIGFIGGSIYLTVKAIRQGKILPSRLATLAAAVLVCLVAAWGPVHERLGANHKGAFDERWQLNFIDLEMIKAHPVVGVGLNNAYESLKLYVPNFFSEGDWVYLAHNQYLHVSAETGLIGLASFIWIISLVFRRLRASRDTDDDLLSSTVTVLLTVMGSLCWGMLLDFYSGMQMYVMLWFMFGASVGVAGLVARERAERAAADPLAA
jgi:O-antigen ligase